eukprot:TRINITY_DN36748_c0_g1_i1.p1 TRINITY_DN36748_c0_g1~~TRINITY_DN36748_c0_g1_i1.p1  ORF type:complete len:545 (+),score=59.06 TRINITY_DN36748_c0_g1_i1:221-1636(+)
MAGVHASCVEAWVQRHRLLQDASSYTPPRCPVCNDRYGGTERRPGLKAFLRRLAAGCARQVALALSEAVRFAILGAILVEYSVSADSRSGVMGPLSHRWEAYHAMKRSHCFGRGGLSDHHDGNKVMTAADSGRIALQSAFPSFVASVGLGMFLVHKVLVLLASLPTGRLPPQRRLLRRAFTADSWCIARHVAELLATVVVLGLRCFHGVLTVRQFAPVLAIALVPTMLLASHFPASDCFREVALFVLFMVSSPLLLAKHLLHLVRTHRRLLANPLHGAAHLVVASLVLLVSIVFQTRRFAMVCFLAHGTFLFVGLTERVVVRRLHWRPGPCWWCAVLVAVEVVSVTLDRRWITLLLLLAASRGLQRAAAHPEPREDLVHGITSGCTLLVLAEFASLLVKEARGAPERKVLVGVAACAWLCLIVALACAVNSKSCIRWYRVWQRRHATFVLLASGSSPQQQDMPPAEADIAV